MLGTLANNLCWMSWSVAARRLKGLGIFVWSASTFRRLISMLSRTVSFWRCRQASQGFDYHPATTQHLEEPTGFVFALLSWCRGSGVCRWCWERERDMFKRYCWKLECLVDEEEQNRRAVAFPGLKKSGVKLYVVSLLSKNLRLRDVPIWRNFFPLQEGVK